jgi:hypothetical protein
MALSLTRKKKNTFHNSSQSFTNTHTAQDPETDPVLLSACFSYTPAAVLPGQVRRLRFCQGWCAGCGFSGAAVPAAVFPGRPYRRLCQTASTAVLQACRQRRQRFYKSGRGGVSAVRRRLSLLNGASKLNCKFKFCGRFRHLSAPGGMREYSGNTAQTQRFCGFPAVPRGRPGCFTLI